MSYGGKKKNTIIKVDNEEIRESLENTNLEISRALTNIEGKKFNELKEVLDDKDNKISMLQKKSLLSVTDFGAKGDGIANDTVAIQQAIDAVPEYGKLVFPTANYLADNLQITKPITIDLQGSKISNFTVDKDIFNVTGNRSTVGYKLSLGLKRREKIITLTEPPTDIKKGDLIVVTDDKVRPEDNTPEINTEVHEVESVNTVNNTIIIKDFIRLPKEVSQVVNVYKINPVKDVDINNVYIQMKVGATKGCGISVKYAKNVKIDNVKTINSAFCAVFFQYGYNCEIERFLFEDPQESLAKYGVRFEKVTGLSIKNGMGKDLRHTIDFHNVFDALVDDVVSYGNTSTAFFISHNGFDSDITLRKCRAYNVHQSGYGYGIHNQGVVHLTTQVGDPYSIAFYGLTMIDCEAQTEDLSYLYGFRSIVPLKESELQNLKLVCGDGKVASVNSNAGIQLLSVDNDVTMNNIHISGFRDGIDLYISTYDSGGKTQRDKSAFVRLNNIIVKNAKYGILANYSLEKNLIISDARFENVSDELFRVGSAKYRNLSIKNINIINSPSTLKLFQSVAIASADGAFGKIENFNTDTSSKTPLSITEGKVLSNEEFYFNLKNETIFITSNNAVSFGINPFPDAIVEGQKFNIYNAGIYDITIPTSKKIVFESGALKVLDSTIKTVSLQWSNGKWYEI